MKKSPPSIPRFLLCLIRDKKNHESLIGDYEEAFHYFGTTYGYVKARIWYWSQVFKALPFFISNSIRWRLVMFKNYLKIALRRMYRHKTYSLINIVGLALGMTVSMLLIVYIFNEHKYDKFHKNLERIYRIEAEWGRSLPPIIGHVLPESVPEIEVCTRFQFPGSVTLSANNNVYTEKNLAFGDHTCFDIFSFDFIHGSPKTALKAPFCMVLTESLAKKILGTIDAIDKTVVYNNEWEFKITGIIKDIKYSHLQIDAVASIVSMNSIEKDSGYLLYTDGWMYPTYALLQKDFNIKMAENKMNQVLKPLADYQNLNFTLYALKDIYFSEPSTSERNTIHGNKRLINLLIMLVILILLIACINFVNLSTAVSSTRNKEIGIRKVIGSSQSQLIYQHIFETALLCLPAIGLSLLIIGCIEHSINNLFSLDLNINTYNSPVNFLIVIGFAVLLGVLSGLYPAFMLSKSTPFHYLKNRSERPELGRFRKGLIVFQFSVSICLVIAVITIQNQLHYIQSKNMDLSSEPIIVLRTNQILRTHTNTFKNNVLNHHGIQNLTYSSYIPGEYWGSWGSMHINGTGKYRHAFNRIDPDFFQTFSIKIVEGRNFSWNRKTDDFGSLIINEASVNKYNLKQPLEMQVSKTGAGIEGPVVGVVKDFHYRSLHRKIEPVVFYWSTQNINQYPVYVSIKISEQNVAETISHIETVWNQICPEFPFDYQFFGDLLDGLYKTEQQFGSIIFIFSMLGIFIACLGILGLVMFSIEKRTKEIGIRKVLGASIPDIFWMITQDFTKWILLAALISWPIVCYAMNKWLQRFAYHVNLNVWIFIISGLAVLVIALLTVSHQTIKAATANPVDSLRYE